VTLDLLERWRRELALRERVDPGDHVQAIGSDGDTALAVGVGEPGGELVSDLAVDSPRARERCVQTVDGPHFTSPFVSPERYCRRESRNGA
jgi:hypothetical protein